MTNLPTRPVDRTVTMLERKLTAGQSTASFCKFGLYTNGRVNYVKPLSFNIKQNSDFTKERTCLL
jgi:hypothetical protein